MMEKGVLAMRVIVVVTGGMRNGSSIVMYSLLILCLVWMDWIVACSSCHDGCSRVRMLPAVVPTVSSNYMG